MALSQTIARHVSTRLLTYRHTQETGDEIMVTDKTTHHIRPLDAEIGAGLVEAVGTPDFAKLLLKAARDLDQVDEVFGYLLEKGNAPRTLVSASVLPDFDLRVDDYVERFYRYDPAVHDLFQLDRRQSFVQRITREKILPHDYRRRCFDDPGFSEKLSFGWRAEGYILVLSFYRVGQSDEAALRKLASLANLSLAIMVNRHAPISDDQLVNKIERKLARAFPTLSPRETQICARSVLGLTSSEIGEELAIGAGTVLTYRQRAYQKTDMSSSHEFLPFLIA